MLVVNIRLRLFVIHSDYAKQVGSSTPLFRAKSNGLQQVEVIGSTVEAFERL